MQTVLLLQVGSESGQNERPTELCLSGTSTIPPTPVPFSQSPPSTLSLFYLYLSRPDLCSSTADCAEPFPSARLPRTDGYSRSDYCFYGPQLLWEFTPAREKVPLPLEYIGGAPTLRIVGAAGAEP